MKTLMLLFASQIPLTTIASTIYACKEERSTEIAFNYEKYWGLIKEGFSAEAHNSPKNPMVISFVVERDKATLKGNLDQVDLIKLTGNTFIETNGMGDPFLWKLFPGKEGKPTYIIQTKTYGMAQPYTISVQFKCD